jgi:hypothetical protein
VTSRRPRARVGVVIIATAIIAVGFAPTTASRAAILPRSATTVAITAVSQSASQLGSDGGAIVFGVVASHAVRCKLAATPAILGLPVSQDCTGNSASWTVTLPPNPTASRSPYLFSITAFGADRSEVTRRLGVTVAAQSPTCPGQTVTAIPTTAAYFNDPTSKLPQAQTAVVGAMINLICSASPPANGVASQINLAMYEYELDSVTQALAWAHQYRDADVHVALDGANTELQPTAGQVAPNPAYDDLLSTLPQGSVVLCGPNAGTVPLPPPGDDADPATRAGTGCAGDAIMHTKLLTVSSIDTAHDSAVMTGAQNLVPPSLDAGFNNGLQIVGNADVYDANTAYLDELLTNTPNATIGETLTTPTITTAAGTVTSQFFPRNASSTFPTDGTYVPANDGATDTTADILDSVSCLAPGAFAGDHKGNNASTTIHIAMYNYTSRPRITKQLKVLGEQGCEVQILYSKMSPNTLSGLKRAGVKPLQLTDGVFIHDKYMLISGGVDPPTGPSTTNQNILVTGSENFTQAGLHDNDEQTMEVQQTATAASGTTPLYDAYEADWSHLATVIARRLARH